MKPNKHLASLALLFLGFENPLGRNWDRFGTDNFAHFLEMTLMCHFVPRLLSHTKPYFLMCCSRSSTLQSKYSHSLSSTSVLVL